MIELSWVAGLIDLKPYRITSICLLASEGRRANPTAQRFEVTLERYIKSVPESVRMAAEALDQLLKRSKSAPAGPKQRQLCGGLSTMGGPRTSSSGTPVVHR
jgi:hypothetical protein